MAGVREGLQEQIDHRCQELAGNCRARAAEQATQLAEQAKQMEPAIIKLTQQMEAIQRLCRQEVSVEYIPLYDCIHRQELQNASPQRRWPCFVSANLRGVRWRLLLDMQLQSVRVALESKASTDQMMELKTVLSEVDKLVSAAPPASRDLTLPATLAAGPHDCDGPASRLPIAWILGWPKLANDSLGPSCGKCSARA